MRLVSFEFVIVEKQNEPTKVTNNSQIWRTVRNSQIWNFGLFSREIVQKISNMSKSFWNHLQNSSTITIYQEHQKKFATLPGRITAYVSPSLLTSITKMSDGCLQISPTLIPTWIFQYLQVHWEDYRKREEEGVKKRCTSARESYESSFVSYGCIY